MNGVSVLILNVFNVHQQQGRWSGKTGEEKSFQTSAPEAFDDVIELSPKNGIWQAAREDVPALEPRTTCIPRTERLTYTRRGGYAAASTTGARINLVV